MSGFLKLNIKDFVKGLIVTMIAAVVTTGIELLKNGLEINKASLGTVVTAALIAGASYLLKNLGTDNDKNEKFVGIVKTK